MDFESEISSLCAITGPSAGLDGSDGLDRKKGSHIEKNQQKAEAELRCPRADLGQGRARATKVPFPFLWMDDSLSTFSTNVQ